MHGFKNYFEKWGYGNGGINGIYDESSPFSGFENFMTSKNQKLMR